MKIVIFLSFCVLLYYENNQVAVCQNMDTYIGRYKYTLSQDLPSKTTILELQTNGRFKYYPYHVSYIGYSNCDTIKGDWITRRNSIILNSDFQTKDYIKVISKYEPRDSIKIKFIRYPSGILLNRMDISLADKKGNFFLAKTNENGIIVIPKEYEVVLFSFSLNPPKIPKLKGGYYYQFTSVDCIPEIFENKQLEIHGDTLIMYEKYNMRDRNEKGRKMHLKSKHEYIKVQNK